MPTQTFVATGTIMKNGIKQARRALIVLTWLSGIFCLYWGYSLALLELVPCNNVFRLDQPIAACAAPLYFIYGGFGLLTAAAALTVIAWIKNVKKQEQRDSRAQSRV